MGFLYHFERQIIKNNKWSSASVEVITTCNRTQRVPSGCLSTVNCRCNGAERRPCVSSGSSHFLVLSLPSRASGRRSCIAISRRSSSLFSSRANRRPTFQTGKLRSCNFPPRLGQWGLCWPLTHSEQSCFIHIWHVCCCISWLLESENSSGPL